MAMNTSCLTGRLTKDPEVKQTQNGTSVVRFTIAVDRNYKDKRTVQYETDFIQIAAWRHNAEFVGKYFRKGNMIAVTGRIQTETWTDQDGNKRRSMYILADDLSFCEKRSPDASYSAQDPEYKSGEFTPLDDVDSDLPF